ncbi:MAG: hypothetical protein IJ845_05460 [Bacteroidaceae bacterium]|nr:hypothetical protein [Bacteroidaceae bacterium]
MKLRKGILIIILFFFCQLEAKNITPILRHYNMNQGLVDNYVTAIHQDKQGYLWVGTRLGLNRFDGYQFKTYRGGINNVRVRSITSDNKGNTYVATSSGLFLYDNAHDEFLSLKGKNGEKIDVSICRFDKEDNLWAIDMKGDVSSYNSQFERQIIYATDSLGYTDFCIDKYNRLWVCDFWGNLSSVDKETGEKVSFYLFDDKEKDLSHKLYRLVPSDYSDKIYVAYEKDDVKIFHIETRSFEEVDIQKYYGTSILINDIIEVAEDVIWIATNKGVIVYDYKKGEFSEISYQPSNSFSLQSQSIQQLFQDMEGNIWIGSRQNGISYYSDQQFELLYPSVAKGGIASSFICDIKQDSDGNLWIASEDNGVSVMDKTTGSITNYTNLPYLDICNIAIYDNKLWVCYYIHGVESYSLSGNRLKGYVLGTRESMVNNHMYALQTLSDGTLLAATADGLYMYNKEEDRFNLVQGLKNNYQYYTIKEDSISHRVWYAGYFCNLKELKNGENLFKNQYAFDLDEINNDFVIDMTNDSQGNAWYLFRHAGVVKYDRKKNESNKISGVPVPVNHLLRIVADNSDKVWISSLSGLISIDIKDNKVMLFDDSYGLLTKQFNYRAGHKDMAGNLYFGTNLGWSKLAQITSCTCRIVKMFILHPSTIMTKGRILQNLWYSMIVRKRFI